MPAHDDRNCNDVGTWAAAWGALLTVRQQLSGLSGRQSARQPALPAPSRSGSFSETDANRNPCLQNLITELQKLEEIEEELKWKQAYNDYWNKGDSLSTRSSKVQQHIDRIEEGFRERGIDPRSLITQLNSGVWQTKFHLNIQKTLCCLMKCNPGFEEELIKIYREQGWYGDGQVQSLLERQRGLMSDLVQGSAREQKDGPGLLNGRLGHYYLRDSMLYYIQKYQTAEPTCTDCTLPNLLTG